MKGQLKFINRQLNYINRQLRFINRQQSCNNCRHSGTEKVCEMDSP